MAYLVVTLATEEGTFKFYLILTNLNIQVWLVATILDSEGLSFSNKGNCQTGWKSKTQLCAVNTVTDKLIVKFTWEARGLSITRTPAEEQAEGCTLAGLRLQSPSSVVLWLSTIYLQSNEEDGLGNMTQPWALSAPVTEQLQ